MAYDASGGQYTKPSITWGEWTPLPQLPSEVSIAPGKCLSGWVLVSAPKNTKFVTFDPSDGEGGSIAEWKVGWRRSAIASTSVQRGMVAR